MATRKTSVLSYIESQKATGKSERQITDELLDKGWHMDIILAALQPNTVAHSDNQIKRSPQTQFKPNDRLRVVNKFVKQAGKTISKLSKKRKKPNKKPR